MSKVNIRPIEYKRVKRSLGWKLIISIIMPFIGFAAYIISGGNMLLPCLVVYITQIGMIGIELASDQENLSVDVSLLVERAKIERKRTSLYVCLYFLMTILDLFPWFTACDSLIGLFTPVFDPNDPYAYLVDYYAIRKQYMSSDFTIFISFSMFLLNLFVLYLMIFQDGITDIFIVKKNFQRTGKAIPK